MAPKLRDDVVSDTVFALTAEAAEIVTGAPIPEGADAVVMVEDTNRSVKDLLMTGLRQRFPHDSPAMLRRRLADLWLGPELSALAYGRLPEPG